MLDINTFTKGMTILEKCYKGFKLESEEILAWYEVIKTDTDEDAFLPLILNYCRTESSPTCPADLIRFGKKILMDNAPAPAFIANELIESVRRMQFDYDFSYSNPSNKEIEEYLLNDLIGHNAAFRQNNIYVIVVTLLNDYSAVIIDTVSRNDSTEMSILTSELKSSYRKELDKTVSRTILTSNLLEGMNPLLLN